MRRAKTNEEHTTEQMRRAKRKSLALVEIPAARASSLESSVLELCNAVWQCEITRLYACQNLDKLRIRTGTIYSGGDFIRFFLDATAPKLNMVSKSPATRSTFSLYGSSVARSGSPP